MEVKPGYKLTESSLSSAFASSMSRPADWSTLWETSRIRLRASLMRTQRQEHRALASGMLDRLAERSLRLACSTLRVLQDLKLASEPQQFRFPEALARARRYSKTVRNTFESIRGIPTHQVCLRCNACQVR